MRAAQRTAHAPLPPPVIDTHAHLYLDAFRDDLEAVLARARDAGVTDVVQPAIDLASIDAALALCARFDGLTAMAAIHPTSVHEAPPDAGERVEAALAHPDVVAVGETGLDYYWSREHVEAQQASLRAHARLALAHDLPIVLHNRDQKGEEQSSRDLVRILREESAGQALRGVFHCFGGPRWLADDALELGLHVGLGGTLTFKNGGVPDAIEGVPLDRIVLETDAPYLAPAPHRGGRNEPAYTRLVAERLADLRGLTLEAVDAATTATARELFALGLG